MDLITTLKEFTKNRILSIPLDMIFVGGQGRLRTITEDNAINLLSQSIKDYGVIQPISVKKLENDMYELIIGFRRFFAAKLANLSHIPAIIIDELDAKIPIIALIDNIHRHPLSIFEEATTLLNLIINHNLTLEIISTMLAIPISLITDRLSILQLSKKVQTSILHNNLSCEYALLLIDLATEESQLKTIDIIKNYDLSISQTKEFINSIIHDQLDLKDDASSIMYAIKDIRLLDNTIDESVKLMNESGIKAISAKSESEDFIEYVVKITKNKKYLNKTAG